MSSFQENIKQWVAVDNRIKTLNNEIKQLRSQKMNMLKVLCIMLKQTNYQMQL